MEQQHKRRPRYKGTHPRRYEEKYKELNPEKYQGDIEKIIQKGIALEVNTSSFGILNDFMPSVDILKKYRDMGGYLITLGSDAHVAKNASLYFGEAIDALKKIGFKNIYYYKNRKPYQIELGSCEK